MGLSRTLLKPVLYVLHPFESDTVKLSPPIAHHRVESPKVSIGSLRMLASKSRTSLYTGNDTYRQLAEGSVQHMIHMVMSINRPNITAS